MTESFEAVRPKLSKGVPLTDPLEAKIGNKFRDAEILDQNAIAAYFSGQGFEVLQTDQLWRHVHGELQKGGERFFFKMASTPEVGEGTQNEAVFNQTIHPLIMAENVRSFDVPQIRESGMYEGKFYYLSSFHEGKFLATKTPPDTSQLPAWLDRIVNVNRFLLSLGKLDFYKDRGKQGFIDGWDDYVQLVTSWYEKVTTDKLEPVYQEFLRLKSVYEPGINHADFVPWHMIEDGDKFMLIDGEHATANFPKFYDIAYFYHRLCTSGKDPEFAKAYLRRVRDALGDSERTALDAALKPILALRIIGGLWDAKMDQEKDLTYHDRLVHDFSNNTLFD